MIAEIAWESLAPGTLAAHFAAGRSAVLVHCPEVVARLWRGLLEDETERLPWEAPIIDIARNYHGSQNITTSLGDLFYFQPGQHGYIARKIEISRTQGETPRARPDHFVQGDDRYALSKEMIDLCWSIGNRLMTAMTPQGVDCCTYRVVVQRLKYQRSTEDFDRLAALTRNALGRWGRMGAALDVRRGAAAGPLRRRWLSDLYALAGRVEPLRWLTDGINHLFARRDARVGIAPGTRVVEGPHVDYRHFSALCGQREDIRTHIYVDGAWHDLPVGLGWLAIMPGSQAVCAAGVPDVLHRVVHLNERQDFDDACGPVRTQNVTLMIGAT